MQTGETESRPNSVPHMHSGHLLPLRSWDSQPSSGGRGSVRLAGPAESQQTLGLGLQDPTCWGSQGIPGTGSEREQSPQPEEGSPMGAPQVGQVPNPNPTWPWARRTSCPAPALSGFGPSPKYSPFPLFLRGWVGLCSPRAARKTRLICALRTPVPDPGGIYRRGRTCVTLYPKGCDLGLRRSRFSCESLGFKAHLGASPRRNFPSAFLSVRWAPSALRGFSGLV